VALGAADVKLAGEPVAPVLGLVPEETLTVVVSEAQDALEPLSKVTVKGEVPPDQLTSTVTVAVCPLSMADGEIVTLGVSSGGLTTTSVAAEIPLDPLELTTFPQ
jgi:hypothetical protein